MAKLPVVSIQTALLVQEGIPEDLSNKDIESWFKELGDENPVLILDMLQWLETLPEGFDWQEYAAGPLMMYKLLKAQATLDEMSA